MLRSHFEFAYVLHVVFISLISSASFNSFCSDDLSCDYPLICSNSSQCTCPRLSTQTFWNTEQNTCLACPKGWIEWQNETCLLFIKHSENDIVHEKAKDACLSYSAQLLKIDYYQEYVEFQCKINELLKGQHANELSEYLTNGVWINFTDTDWLNSYEWCDKAYKNDSIPRNDCIRLSKYFSKDKINITLCLSHIQCNETLSYICEKSPSILNDDTRFFSLIAGAVENLFFPAPKPIPTQPPPPPEPLIIFHTKPPREEEQPLTQTSKSNNTTLYIGIAVGVILLILMVICCCCFCGGFLLWKSNDTPKASSQISRFYRRRDRTSVDSAASDATY
ncbi:unnamed protein product [Rotaria magnacalcarata]|uniref:C-type lectin domain-containing protein n=2 Tax=Rotaria magnacalcarata TaxID=392030 RepID=A0A8S3AJV4_9BILA|nr:unnamed protein product [Rotaria magnacalcarata]